MFYQQRANTNLQSLEDKYNSSSLLEQLHYFQVHNSELKVKTRMQDRYHALYISVPQ